MLFKHNAKIVGIPLKKVELETTHFPSHDSEEIYLFLHVIAVH